VSLLERDRELTAMAGALDAGLRGEGSSVLIEGPAGIGKSALLAAVRAQALADGYRVLSGTGGEVETDLPYGVVRQLFLPATRLEPDLFVGAAQLARPLIEPESAHGIETSALEALHGLYWLTVNLAARSPVLIAVDDAHWCDGASLRFLLYLRRRLEDVRTVVAMTTRPGEPGADEHLLRLVMTEVQPALRPATLSPDAVAALLRRGLGHDPDSEFTTAAHTATDGNPFLVGELVTALAARDVPPTRHAAATVTQLGVEGVTRSILRRLTALGTGAVQLAQAVAVFGGGCDLRHAAELAGADEADAAHIVDGLVRVQILRDTRVLTFAHPLVRAAIYFDIPATVRARAHARAARILERHGAGDDVVAAHLLESEPTGDDAVVVHLRGAARNASRKGAMDVAVRYLRRAIAEPPPHGQHELVLQELGAAELAAGEPDAAAERLAEAAARAPDRESQLSIVLMRRHALVLADRIGEAVAVVDQASAGDRDLLEAAAIGAGHLDLTVARGLAERLNALRRRATEGTLREPLALAVAAATTAMANGSVRDTNAIAEQCLVRLADIHPSSDYSVHGQVGLALLVAERHERLVDLASGWLEDSRRAGSIPRFISMAWLRSAASYRMGALADAEADARDAFEAARLYKQHFWVPAAVSALINPLVDRGLLDEAEQVLTESQVGERYRDSSSFSWAAHLLPARGRLRMAKGEIREGLADFLAGERFDSAVYRSPSLWPWRSGAALAFAALGENERSRALAAQEVELARGAGTPRALGMALRAAGQITGDVALLQESVAVLAASTGVLEHARALTDLGAMLRRRGRRGEARAPLRAALELASRCGADALAQRALDELSASGAHIHRGRLNGPEALTASERRVAGLAADGRTNPEIAQSLFLARRTVETHLTHAYQKLGIRSREELAGALSRGASTTR
jgi:DNA-binding CsgD family transcriptional regulator